MFGRLASYILSSLNPIPPMPILPKQTGPGEISASRYAIIDTGRFHTFHDHKGRPYYRPIYYAMLKPRGQKYPSHGAKRGPRRIPVLDAAE